MGMSGRRSSSMRPPRSRPWGSRSRWAGGPLTSMPSAVTGIDTLHVWAYPVAGGAPMFVGTATTGGLRPDVAVVYGEQFRAAGYGLIVQGLAPGTYDLAVFAWSHVVGGFVPAAVVRVTVQ